MALPSSQTRHARTVYCQFDWHRIPNHPVSLCRLRHQMKQFFHSFQALSMRPVLGPVCPECGFSGENDNLPRELCQDSQSLRPQCPSPSLSGLAMNHGHLSPHDFVVRSLLSRLASSSSLRYVGSPPRPLQQVSCRWCSQERRKAKGRRPTGFDLPHRGCSAVP